MAENQAAKTTVLTKEETPAEAEARLRAQVAATRENSIEDVPMQVDSDVRIPSKLRIFPNLVYSLKNHGFLFYNLGLTQ